MVYLKIPDRIFLKKGLHCIKSHGKFLHYIPSALMSCSWRCYWGVYFGL